MFLRLSLFFILITVTTSAFALSARQISQSYQEWMRCHNNTSDPTCPPCEDERADPTDAIGQFLEVRCLPSQRESEYVFSNQLTREQRNDRDQRICSCYLNGEGGGLEAYSFSSGTVAPQSVGLTTSASSAAIGDILFNQRVLTVLSATSYTRSDADFENLGGRYSFASPDVRNLETATTAIGGVFGGTFQAAAAILGTPEVQASRREADRRLLDNAITNSTQLPAAQFCIPYRNFLASQEFPRGESFYQDLRGMRDFNTNDWNYNTLMNTYRTLKGSRDEDEFIRSSQGKQIYERLSFLHNNPVIRDVFLSPETPVTEATTQNKLAKEQVFQQIKKMPSPCREANCSQNMDWIRQMQNYRREMMGVLNDRKVIDATQAGADDYRRMVISLTNLRANQQGSSDAVIGASASYDSSQWRNFCANRDRNDAVSTFDQLTENFGERNAVDPSKDDDYRTLNERVCTENRVSKAGRGRNLRDYESEFRRTNCSGPNPSNRLCNPSNRPELVAQFIREFPADSDTGDEDTLWAIVPYIEGEMRISSVADASIGNLNTIASSPERQRESFSFTEPGVPNYSSSLSKNATRTPASTPTTNPQTASTPERLQGTPGNTAQAEPFIVPIAPQAEVTPAVQAAQAELAEGEGESQRIREEISSLRDVMRRDPQEGGPRDSQAMESLTQRLASLERRLQTRESENRELRDQIAEAESERTSIAQRPQVPTSGSSDDGRRSAPGAAQSVAQGGASAGSSIAAPGVSGGAGQSSSVSGRTGGAISRPVISSGNAALLSKYGVQSGSVQGALIVANPSTTIDYQALRSQSEGSVLSLPLPIEEYNLIASNNQEALRPYLDQCRALAGSVCRLNISSPGTTNQLELFVVKNGNEVSIIPTNSPDRRTAALPTGARVFTLNELVNEVQTQVQNR